MASLTMLCSKLWSGRLRVRTTSPISEANKPRAVSAGLTCVAISACAFPFRI